MKLTRKETDNIFNTITSEDCRVMNQREFYQATVIIIQKTEIIIYPVFDLLEKKLNDGTYFLKQDGVWNLFDKTGNSICSGVTIKQMLIDLIFKQKSSE